MKYGFYDIDEAMKTFENSENFYESVENARRYHKKWYHVEGHDKERMEEYNSLSESEKFGLEYLVYIGEIN